MIHFRPKLLDCLPGYSGADALRDASAGLTVGVLALPLAMAFAIASGMSPSSGIWTAIVAGFVIAALGGSRVQIGGPTGAFIPIIFGIVAQYGVANLLIATLLAGILLLAMGLARLGGMIRFIPVSVVIGFTNGIAVVIFLSQIKDFLGLRIAALPADFFPKMRALAEGLPTVDIPTTAFAIASLVVLLGWNTLAKRWSPLARLPGPLAVLVIATTANVLFDLPIETIGSRFGGIPQSLPEIAFPAFDLDKLRHLIAPAITIALLGAIESLLSARVADTQIEDRHDPNQELVAQGLANIAASLFGGFAATGAIARTATNIKSGGRTPVAGMVHAVTLLAVVLLAAPLAHHVPLATLSAIVVLVAVNMGEWHEFRELMRYSLNYRTTLLSTFFITVIFDLSLAVEIGMALASLFFIYRMSDLTRLERLPLEDFYGSQALSRADGSPRIVAYRLFGSLFFGAANKLDELITAQRGQPDVLILDLSKAIHIDTTGLEILELLHRELDKNGATLVLAGLNQQPLSILTRSGFIAHMGADNVLDNLTEAILRAQSVERRPMTIHHA